MGRANKKGWLVVVGYLAMQLIIGLAQRQLHINNQLHLVLLVVTSLAYLVVALKDPGYVKLTDDKKEQINEKQNQLKVTKEEKKQHLDVVKQGKQGQVDELGINSQIKVEENKDSKLSQVVQMDPHAVEGEIVMALNANEPQILTLPPVLLRVQRYCSVCKSKQQLRVRHCIDCDRCVSTFDHHCPWINNCVGEKTKLFLLLFLILQQVQFFSLIVDILNNFESGLRRQELMLCLVCLLFGIVLFAVLLFHFYLISINTTTWQKLRWYRIQYLMIFNQSKLKSLFDQGICKNIGIFFVSSCSSSLYPWKTIISPKAEQCIDQPKNSNSQRRFIPASLQK